MTFKSWSKDAETESILDAAVQQAIAENTEQIRKAWMHLVLYGSYYLHDDGDGKLTAIDPIDIVKPLEAE